jgi:hypothetical protein
MLFGILGKIFQIGKVYDLIIIGIRIDLLPKKKRRK